MQIKSWQTKYEESSLELISERQKLLDAQHSRSENFYLQRDNNKLQKQLSMLRKQVQDLESRQEIQQITLETNQMTKKLIEDRKKSEEQHLRDDLDALREELHAAQEKVKSHEELVAEVKQLQEKITILQAAGTVKAAPQDAVVSSNEEAHSEVRLDEKFKYEDGKEREEKNVSSLNKQERNSDDLKRLGYEEMRQEIDVLARELAAAQKEAQYLREKVTAKEKLGSLASTPLLDTKVGSNRQLRREKIQAENAKMEAEFALKIAQEEIQSLARQLQKSERKISMENTAQLDNPVALENARKEILQLKDQIKEYEVKISSLSDKAECETTQKLMNVQKELQDLEVNFKDVKAKIAKLENGSYY